ncbi:MAG: lasso peptide biosynthesis B2 protein [Paracoccaceae bacterium]
MSRLTTFLRQPAHRKALFVEALFRLCHAWFIVRKSGFTKRAPYLGTKHAGDWIGDSSQNIDKIRDVRWAINKACSLTGHRFTCLMIALAGKEMLRRFDIPNSLVLGAMKSPKPGNPELLAHAWLRSGRFVILGKSGMHRFSPIVSYVDKKTNQK